MRKEFVIASIIVVVANIAAIFIYPPFLWSMVVFGPLLVIGYFDFFQPHRGIRRNFPIVGNFRYIFELIRPEINQYFVESNTDGKPFSREQRSIVYQRAKGQLDTLPFGTQKNVDEIGYEWVNHSFMAKLPVNENLRVVVGGPDCAKPYNASILNISAMSYGALSKNAILSLNGGAKDGGFAHNTGEGGLSPFHLEPGGDLIWQIGTGYFGCRASDGRFSPERFAENSQVENVKMIEIKISQGAKPGHGGILPAAKVSKEIAAIRGVPVGQDVMSPPAHSAFSTPLEFVEFVQTLRKLSGGKPVGMKFCVGKRREFLAICKAMVETGITPDYVAVDGGEGGTGAAPFEFSNHVGAPLMESLIFVHNALVGVGVREKVKVIAGGKVTTGFGIIKRIAAGADLIYSARAMMMALGCIQALRCNANVCPAGIATQDPYLNAGIHVPTKRKRVQRFHHETVKSAAHILGAMGLDDPSQLRPWHVMRRVGPLEVRHYGEIFEFLEKGSLLGEHPPKNFERAYKAATSRSFSAGDTAATTMV
ncbi:MAG: FMN-binding glutamate synthase family protein [Pseudobdellovibrionaceae bacterium]|nr:FMN-binding glutamate synthase family protein [Bdellovibrionales bacterium]USN47949.1 MAG: FMN-binding glutamate synthase family protein [Pseudobdellovibrionaceae bacterium]